MILDILGVNMQKMTYLGLTIIVKTLKTNIFISDIEILLIQNVLICSYKIWFYFFAYQGLHFYPVILNALLTVIIACKHWL